MEDRHVIQKGLSDEVFNIRSEGLVIKIHLLIDALNDNLVPFDIYNLSINFLKGLVVSDNINHKVIDRMTNSRRDQPLICIQISGKYRVIDGNHRLLKRENDNFEACDVVEVSLVDLSEFCEPLYPLPKRARAKWFSSIFGSVNA